MKKLQKLLIAGVMSFSFFGFTAESDAATNSHYVNKGETYWTIASKYGVSVLDIKKANNRSSDRIYTGEKLRIPNSNITAADRELLARLVHAEAKGESYAGKVAVATVVLNRIESPLFPNTVRGVIYEKVNGHYAFTPVQNGAINQSPDQASRRAVEEALAFRGQGNGSLYFFNPKTSTSKWVFSRKVTVTIGKHRFAK